MRITRPGSVTWEYLGTGQVWPDNGALAGQRDASLGGRFRACVCAALSQDPPPLADKKGKHDQVKPTS